MRFKTRLASLLLSFALAANVMNATQIAGNGTRLCSIGYTPEVAKLATIVGAQDAKSFRLVDAATGAVAFEGTLSAPRESKSTNEKARIADFSNFSREGTYILKIDGLPDSEPFAISGNAVDRSLYAVMLGFYGQRCGQAVKLDWKGRTFAHAACHLAPSKLDIYDKSLVGQTRDATGGWHDAGDYGRYAVNSAFTCAIMLEAWERNEANLAKLKLPIPEHGGALPDYLAEVKNNLDWMLKLQMADGRVSLRVTTQHFAEWGVLPEDDNADTFFAPWTKQSTINYAAVGCMVARVYEKYDPAYAAKWREVARKAWLAVRGVPDFSPDFTGYSGGTYLCDPHSDTLWALIELRLTFGEEFLTADELRQFMAAVDNDNRMFVVSWDWGNGYNLGLLDYLFSDEAKANPEILSRLKTDLIGAADAIVANSNTHAYGRGIRVCYWGCNGVVVRTSLNLQAAYLVTGDKKYLDAAYDQIAYIYGRNPFDRSFVTGDGINPPMFPHYRLSFADKVVEPWPGHLVGGPDSVETGWFDDTSNYRTNEIAINWDASLAYALSIFYRGE
jgi:endoglucanase